jgi:hypothetical protein
MMETAQYIRVNGLLYKRADGPVTVDPDALMRAWKSSREYTEFLPTIVHRYEGDLRGFAEKLRDKFFSLP